MIKIGLELINFKNFYILKRMAYVRSNSKFEISKVLQHHAAKLIVCMWG